MRGAITSTTVFGTVIMARQGSNALILVVEGDDDHFMVKAHVNDGDVILIGGNGRPKVLEAAAKAERQGMRGVRFLVDADYDKFTQPMLRYPSNVVSSQNHDAMIDVVLANLSVLDRVIASHARSVERRGGTLDPAQVRQEAFTLAAAVAPLRIVNERNGHNLRLINFPFGSLPSIRPTHADLAGLAIGRSDTSLVGSQLESEIASERSHAGVSEHVLVGDHDLFRALSRVLSDHGVNVRPDALWTTLLPAIDCRELRVVAWYQELVEWGAANSRVTFNCRLAA